MNNHPKLSLIEHFKNLPDPRIHRQREHDLVDIMVIAVCTLICVGETFNDMEDFGRAKEDWFRTFLRLPNGIPSHDTFNRVFAALDPKEFLDCFLRWTQSLRQAIPQEIVAMDGKALRRALDQDQNVKYIVSAWAENNSLLLGQLKVADKSNEITALPELLRVLELSGCIVTMAATYPDLPVFAGIERMLWQSINRTQVWEVNARLGRTPEVVWQSDYAHILVGGQAMDRGFTVEGLTVTYMPRGKGVGNADTIQQRARFLGYKRSYLGLCRVFLEEEVQRAYTVYVTHEENVREQLRQQSRSGRPLSEWRRMFFLDRNLQPTRRCVLDLNYQYLTTSEWFYPRAPHFTAASIAHNQGVVAAFAGSLQFAPTNGHDERTANERHGYARVRADELYELLLTQVQLANPGDSQQFTGLLLQIREFLDRNPDAAANVYLMGWTQGTGQISRQRTLDENSEIVTSGAFFSGASVESRRFLSGEVYPGDREIKVTDELSVQIHLLDLLDRQSRTVIAQRTPAVAVWTPAGLAMDTLVQDLPQ